MIESINLLKDKYNQIKNLGWIKSSRKGPTGIGKTFEDLLEKQEDSFCFPDYYGIEIKTKRYNTRQPFSLFSVEPDGEKMFESERIRLNYGYPHKKFPQFMVFGNTIKASKHTLTKNYKFTLSIDHKQKLLFLVIKDLHNNIIDKKTYWSFELLQQCLERKLKYLAIFKAKSKHENDVEFFKYDKMTMYENVKFKNFLDLLEQGKVFINFNIGVFTGEYRFGQPHNHGTSFNIYEDDIKFLYENHYVVD